MSMRYTGRNWKTCRKIWQRKPFAETADVIAEARRIEESKKRKAFIRAARESGAIDNYRFIENDLVVEQVSTLEDNAIQINEHPLKDEIIEALESGKLIAS